MRLRCGRFACFPRLSVSIIFKMLPCQSFKTLRLFDLSRLDEYLLAFLSRRLAAPFPFRLGSLMPACLI